MKLFYIKYTYYCIIAKVSKNPQLIFSLTVRTRVVYFSLQFIFQQIIHSNHQKWLLQHVYTIPI